MNTVRAFFLLLAACVFGVCSTSVHAMDMDNAHLCTAADLHGMFIMINLTETPEGAEASWYRQVPFHYMTFYPNNGYSSVAVGNSIDKLSDLGNALKEKSKPDLKYKIADNGVLQLMDGMNIQYAYRCYAVNDNGGANQKGDLILSGHANGNPSNLVKLYRPVTKDMDVQ